MPSIAEVRSQFPQYEDLSDQQLADALYGKFYSDIPRSEFDAKIGLTVQPVEPDGNVVAEYASQGISGFNEGLGNILGFPVDLTTMGLNAGIMGINALGGSLPQITNPVGGSDFLKSTILAPTIAPESDDAGQQVVRRIGEELGAMAVPGMGPVARSAMPLRTLGSELGITLGSGTGAAIAEQLVPDGPLAPVAEFAGQVAGGFGPASVANLLRRPASPPTIDALRTEKNAAYRDAESVGATYSPQNYDDMLTGLAQDVTAAHISPTRHARAASFIQDMLSRRGKPMSLTEIDQLRQEVRRDLITPSYTNQEAAADAFFGDMILDRIDEMIATVPDASQAMLKARQANTTLRKSELVEEAITKAVRRTESTGSGGNINNAIRQNIRQILDNPKRRRAFSKEEIDAMEELVKQGRMENFLRLVGKLSPSGNGLMAALGIGGTMINPAIGGISLGGAVAKALADRGTVNKATQLQNRVARGAPASTPLPTRNQLDQRIALLLSQGANQNSGPLQITVGGGVK